MEDEEGGPEEGTGPRTISPIEIFNDKYMLMNMIYRITSELNYKESEVYDMFYIKMLRWLEFFKEKDKAKSEEIEKQKKGSQMKTSTGNF